jgi:hypothetical protein
VGPGRGRYEVSDPQRLGPEPDHARPPDEPHCVRGRATGRGGPDGRPPGRHAEQAVAAEYREAAGGGPGKPSLEGAADAREIRPASGERDHGKRGRPMDRVEVEDVEPADHRSVEKNRAHPLGRGDGAEQRDDPRGPVPAVHPYAGEPGRLEMVGGGEYHGSDRGVPVPSFECAVVDADDPRVRLTERPPQRYDLAGGRGSPMSPPTVRMVCPRCGQPLAAVLAPAPPTQWFPCPHCGTPVPIVVPRDPPPAYSWEVLPGLYPNLPPPRRSRRSVRPMVAIALALVAVVAAGLIGALANYGVEASAPFHYSITGYVYLPSSAAATGARVVLTTDGGEVESYTVGPNGTFSFHDVPSGGASLNVTLLNYAPVTVDTFASPVYNAGTTDLGIGLSVGNASNGTTVILSPFPDLESFVSTIGAEAVLLGLVAVVAGATAALTYRRDRYPLGVVAGGAGVAVPATLYLLSLSSVFPTAALVAGVAGSLGAFAMALNAIQLARSGAPVRSG